MPDRHLKSYDDIADYLVEQFRTAIVQELPSSVWDVLAENYSNFIINPMFFCKSGMSGAITLRCIQHPDSLEIEWLVLGERVAVQRFTRPRSSPTNRDAGGFLLPSSQPRFQTFGSHDSTGNSVED